MNAIVLNNTCKNHPNCGCKKRCVRIKAEITSVVMNDVAKLANLISNTISEQADVVSPDKRRRMKMYIQQKYGTRQFVIDSEIRTHVVIDHGHNVHQDTGMVWHVYFNIHSAFESKEDLKKEFCTMGFDDMAFHVMRSWTDVGKAGLVSAYKRGSSPAVPSSCPASVVDMMTKYPANVAETVLRAKFDDFFTLAMCHSGWDGGAGKVTKSIAKVRDWSRMQRQNPLISLFADRWEDAWMMFSQVIVTVFRGMMMNTFYKCVSPPKVTFVASTPEARVFMCLSDNEDHVMKCNHSNLNRYVAASTRRMNDNHIRIDIMDKSLGLCHNSVNRKSEVDEYFEECSSKLMKAIQFFSVDYRELFKFTEVIMRVYKENKSELVQMNIVDILRWTFFQLIYESRCWILNVVPVECIDAENCKFFMNANLPVDCGRHAILFKAVEELQNTVVLARQAALIKDLCEKPEKPKQKQKLSQNHKSHVDFPAKDAAAPAVCNDTREPMPVAAVKDSDFDNDDDAPLINDKFYLRMVSQLVDSC